MWEFDRVGFALGGRALDRGLVEREEHGHLFLVLAITPISVVDF